MNQQVTWQWTDEDIALWSNTWSQDEAYREQCRKWKSSYAAFGVGICAMITRMAGATWWQTALAVILGGALIFGVLELYLRWYTRRTMAEAVQEARASINSTDLYTLIVESDGLRIRTDGSEHWYHWKHFAGATLINGDFLSITIKDIGEPFYIPPSAFASSTQRDAFMARLNPYANPNATATQSGPWWRQRQGSGG